MNLDANGASITEAIEAGLLAGAVTLVWHAGEVVQVNELGHRDIAAGLPMQRDTVFRIASMTKPVTVAAAMTLVEEGRFTLRDEIARWVPELAGVRVLAQPNGPVDATVPLRRPITFEDLMTHRSGLAYPFSVTGPLARSYARLSYRQNEDRWLAELAQLPLAHQPGERVTYSHGTDVLGIALGRIAGKPLHELLAERIFTPLGMADTGFALTLVQRRRLATMYAVGEEDRLRDDVMGPPPLTPPDFCAGGAGLMSTADDYLQFARMLLGDGAVDGVRVLSPESVRLMRTDRLTDEQKQQNFLGGPFWIGRGFGLSMSVVTDPDQSRQFFGPGGLGTFGWPGAYGTWWQADPANDVVLLYLIQNFPDLSADVAAVRGNTSMAKLQSAQPKFVRRTYQGLGL
ncbi:serine hydrolase domain-containing protein [Mycolicibacterium fluoranthenivorans]|uniref:CubicO group peptidase (Beta-lactamase class C family) n=1 Tax=Mycolicibacterium fluoranthenivorans TaxID=258505 RepID=A0A7X5U029_9MYCO|nr:serine hydrolase domain-containing protein [Mycolicibacterium fluoranthenivorans]MCV7357999.1 beta-lactamase family protein [Mycolicibacterium fluoranthenivorans]NIH95882.1 CubicO group peptidase (beta-lactamase class C family) [Mycolicibacterium fluoranthenivorans]